MENILLSICISSYNRGKQYAGLVRKLLAVGDNRYNISICDDCSDSKNMNELLPLQSSKVTLIRNKNNKGACSNWYQTINCGNGKYVLHILDRDDIFVSNIKRLLDILEKTSVAGGYIGMSAMNLTRIVRGKADYEVLKKAGRLL